MWGFNLSTCLQAFTTSPVWISTVQWHKCYQREGHWMSPSPFTLHLIRYRGGSCVNMDFFRLRMPDKAEPDLSPLGKQQASIKPSWWLGLFSLLVGQGDAWTLLVSASPPTPSISPLPRLTVEATVIYNSHPLQLRVLWDFPCHCKASPLTRLPGSWVPLQQQNQDPLQEQEAVTCQINIFHIKIYFQYTVCSKEDSRLEVAQPYWFLLL